MIRNIVGAVELPRKMQDPSFPLAPHSSPSGSALPLAKAAEGLGWGMRGFRAHVGCVGQGGSGGFSKGTTDLALRSHGS